MNTIFACGASGSLIRHFQEYPEHGIALLAACEELRAAFMDGCGDATKGPKRARLVKAGAAMDAAIALARGPAT